MEQAPPGTYHNRLREFRDRMPRGARITQQKLADALSITQSAYNALERGRTELTPRKAQIIAKILECQPWELSADLEEFAKSYSAPPTDKKKRPKR